MNNLSSEELVQIHATAREARLPIVWTEKKALAHFKDKITPEVVEAMSSELLALREAGKEPVAYTDIRSLRYLHNGGDVAKIWGEQNDEPTAIPLYAAPQLPAVPDEVTAADCPAFIKYDTTDVDDAWSRGYNECREAMIAAAPKSE